jgi:hypothetical protein
MRPEVGRIGKVAAAVVATGRWSRVSRGTPEEFHLASTSAPSFLGMAEINVARDYCRCKCKKSQIFSCVYMIKVGDFP